MSALFDAVARVDQFTWVCLIIMAGGGAALVSNSVGSWLLSLLFFPGLLAGGAVFRVEMQQHAIVAVADKKIDTIVMVAVGGILSLLAMLVVVRALMAVSDWFTPVPKRAPQDASRLATRRL